MVPNAGLEFQTCRVPDRTEVENKAFDRSLAGNGFGVDDRFGFTARPVDFDRAPFLVIWETTRACALACWPRNAATCSSTR